MSQKERRRVMLDFTGQESMTKQSFKDQCDVNLIMKRAKVNGGQFDHVTGKPMTFGDFTQVNDYFTALNAVQAAKEGFLQLPSHMRKRFDNDPHKLLQFLDDPNNLAEAIELGFAKAPDDVVSPPLEAGSTT